MIKLYHIKVLCVVLSSLCQHCLCEVRVPKCPIGFREVSLKDEDEILCYYKKKYPEKFEDKYKNCNGNLFTVSLLDRLNDIDEQEEQLWTDYKTVYPGGPYLDWSFTSEAGDLVKLADEVGRALEFDAYEQLCVVRELNMELTAVRCDEQHYRYCIVKAYHDSVDRSDNKNGLNFWEPLPASLTIVASVRATWTQSQKVCKDKGGSLLNRAWVYTNCPYLYSGKTRWPRLPLAITYNTENSSLRYATDTNFEIIPSTDYQFGTGVALFDNALGGIAPNASAESEWFLVNQSAIFYDVICEMPLEVKHVHLTVTVDSKNGVRLIINDTDLREKYIYCLTDSTSYYPQHVEISKRNDKVYVLTASENGYYWCSHNDSKKFHISESNKALYVKVKESTKNIYALKINVTDKYTIDDIRERKFKNKIAEYVYKNSPPETREWGIRKPEDAVQNLKLKRVYLDGVTALVHVELHPNMPPAPPGVWKGIQFEYMKPVYYCEKNNTELTLGMMRAERDLKSSCVGDYNDGVTTIITYSNGKLRSNQATSSSSEEDGAVSVTSTVYLDDVSTTTETETTEYETTTDYSYTTEQENITYYASKPTAMPPIIKPPPIPETTTQLPITTPSIKDQFNDAIHGLEALVVSNVSVTVNDIEETFEQVDAVLDLLDGNEELVGGSNLLHLLDRLGGAIDLNGTGQASTVRNNLALLIADDPIRGIRIAAREDSAFTPNAFEFIRDELNSTHLSSNESEVVVELPLSVAQDTRRVSFVVFRNDRAFHSDSASGAYAVNSRVLSVNVQNFTNFNAGEEIYIYLTPTLSQPERNQTRACAYWSFNDDDSTSRGQWAQDGCELVPARGPDLLDACRCNHLTHFAEILVPRTLFSEANESALEIISVVGCCLSMLGLLIVALTAVLFRSWRREFGKKIWLHLSAAIFLLSLCFLVVSFVDLSANNAMCVATGVALHYASLASFCWMLVAAVLSYRRLVMVFTRDASHKLLRASAFAWGAPFVCVGVLLAAAPHAYSASFEDTAPSAAFCYPQGLALWLSVYAPIATMLVVNWCLFALIIRSVFGSRRVERHGDGRSSEALRCASVSCLLVFLFGLPWLFGLFAFNLVCAYIFTILATFQGFALFLFFVVGNKNTRELWLDKLKIKQSRKVPVTSSTYTNRSGAAAAPAPPLEARASKPRSLTSSDNSRFS